MSTRVVAVLFCLMIAACGGDTVKGVLRPVAVEAEGARRLPMLAVTSRGFDAATGDFTNERAKSLSFQSLVLSIPPGHKDGEIEWPEAVPGDPKRHFVTLANQVFDETRLHAALDRSLPPSGEVLVFVHGYNTEHEEGVFRLGQIAADSGIQALPVLFSWPSRGNVTDYLTDRESTLAARNRLRHFLTLLSRHPRVKRFDVMAHSMGTFLTMETLVQAKLAGDGEFAGRLNTLILAAPDIDVDVFMSQFEVIGRRPRPTVILISRDDKALKVSSRLAGDVVRVGAASSRARASVEAIRKLGFTVIDLTGQESGDRANHATFATSPLVVRQLGNQLRGGLGKSAQGSSAGAFVLDTTGALIEAPSRIFNTVTGR
jgi:esterase/lipase superfamily enzyme